MFFCACIAVSIAAEILAASAVLRAALSEISIERMFVIPRPAGIQAQPKDMGKVAQRAKAAQAAWQSSQISGRVQAAEPAPVRGSRVEVVGQAAAGE